MIRKKSSPDYSTGKAARVSLELVVFLLNTDRLEATGLGQVW
jgi:hypothetical protein